MQRLDLSNVLSNVRNTIDTLPQRRISIIVLPLLISLAIANAPAAAIESPRGASGADAVSRSIEGFQIVAHLEKHTVNAGEPIVIHLALKNTGKEEILFTQHLDSFPEEEYQLEVKHHSGEAMPLTKYGKIVPHILACETDRFTLKGGQEVRHKLLVNRIRDMTFAGKYTVTIKCFLSNKNK